MKNAKRILILLCALLLPSMLQAEQKKDLPAIQNLTDTNAAAKINITDNGVYLSNFSTEELKAFFDEMKYLEYINPPGNTFPACS